MTSTSTCSGVVDVIVALIVLVNEDQGCTLDQHLFLFSSFFFGHTRKIPSRLEFKLPLEKFGLTWKNGCRGLVQHSLRSSFLVIFSD